jgi:hypothetical protein
MSKQFLMAACAIVALAASSQAFGQSSIAQEDAAAARNKADAARVAALIEAEKKRPRVGGYWQLTSPVKALSTIDGKAPPLTSAGRALYGKTVAGLKAKKSVDPMDACTPPGTPRAMAVDEPFMIAQTPAKITFFHQIKHVIRHVYLDGPLKLGEDRDVLWEGHSSGRWEGDTLVIESGDFNGKQWIDNSGLPQSPDMRTVEKIRRVDANTLEDLITFTDAKYYSAPWSTRLTYRSLPSSTILVEDDCAEKLLDFPMKPYAPQ